MRAILAVVIPPRAASQRELLAKLLLHLGEDPRRCEGVIESRKSLGLVAILLDRDPDLRTIPDEPPTFQPNPAMTGVKTLPLAV